MNITKLNLVYFSAAGTTWKVINEIAKGTGIEKIKRYDLLLGQNEEVKLADDELTIFAAPIYAGRVPEVAMEAIKKFKGNNSPAMCVLVYGNRGIDDALFELCREVRIQGFIVASASAFIGQHSLFGKVGENRPDKQDLEKAYDYGSSVMMWLDKQNTISSLPEIDIPGDYPYRRYGHVPFRPITNDSCNFCGICIEECPTGAINPDNPADVDYDKCISCAHCITVCPQHAKSFGGEKYFEVAATFYEKNKKRQEPIIIERK